MKVWFGNRLIVEEMPNGLWKLVTPFYIFIQDGDTVYELLIPAGFITDFCSVPRIPFAYLLMGGIGYKAGAGHDALYSPWGEIKLVNVHTREPKEYDRAWADRFLEAALEACDVSQWKIPLMYARVYTFGWRYYKKEPMMILQPV